MSQNWKRRQWGIVRPQLETLEGREVPAGNIQAIVTGGVLTIRTDNDDFHAFNVSGLRSPQRSDPSGGGLHHQRQRRPERRLGGQHHAAVSTFRPAMATTSIVISDVNGRDFLSIVTNGGDDVVHVVNRTRSHDSTWVRTGDGNDIVIVNGSTFRDHFAIDTGTGNDQALIGPEQRFRARRLFRRRRRHRHAVEHRQPLPRCRQHRQLRIQHERPRPCRRKPSTMPPRWPRTSRRPSACWPTTTR